MAQTIVWKVRLPRICAALLVGAALSIAGAVYQGLFKNPMVSPDILGASSGAGFGAALAILLSLPYAFIQVNAFAFGIVAWDYSGTFLSIDGRTNGMFMAMWGVLGVVWIKLCLPWMLKLVNLIPWNWRYALTTVCAALMIVDGAMTLLSLDCWYQRMAGKPSETAMAQFFDRNFDNEYMQERFQSMSIDPSNATRAN